MLDKIQRGCVLIFTGVFALVWGWLLVTIVLSYEQSKKVGMLAVVLCGIVAAFILVCRKYLRNMWKNERLWSGCAIVLLMILATGLLYCGMELRVHPGWDFGSVYQGAIELTEDGMFSEDSRWYFTTYPNNMAVCLFLAVFFKLFGGLGSYITLGVLLNVALLVLGIFFFYRLVKALYGTRLACLGLLVCVLFFPFYMHAPIFYTDTFAMPFVTGSFLAYQLREKDSRFLALAGVILGLGYKVKGSLGVILVALLIHTWLQKDRFAEQIKKSVLLLVPFLLIVGFLTMFPKQLSLVDETEIEKNEFPVEHWVAMGLEGYGGYNADVYWMTASVEGKSERKAVDRAFISEKLEEYGALGMAEHLKGKMQITWGDGVYFAPEKLKREPLKESWLHSWVLYDGVDYLKTYLYCNAVQILLLMGVLMSVLRNFLEKGRPRECVVMQVAVFGVLLFLLIWETRSRYLLNFVPIFILLGIDGIQGIAAITKRQSTSNK